MAEIHQVKLSHFFVFKQIIFIYNILGRPLKAPPAHPRVYIDQ